MLFIELTRTRFLFERGRMSGTETVVDDVWIRSNCDICLSFCGTLAHRVNGRIVKVEGDPENPNNHGRVCAKGMSAIFNLYNPRRVTTPLRRTNREKGYGIDPKFEPISWDEAINLVVERLKKIRAEDPQRLYFTSFDLPGLDLYAGFCLGFGTVPKPFSSGFYCGNNVHNIHGITTMSVEASPDAEYVKYLLLVGSQFGSVVNYDVMHAARGVARKRPGGIKVVSVDPVGSYGAAKAEEWVPIRPGTDGAFLLALINLLINEYKIYDAEFLKRRTNAPYLVGPDKHYVRDRTSGKPLMWDPVEDRAKPFDESFVDFALEGSYVVDGVECQPSFQVLKDHVRKYTPEYASEITTIAPDTIRRIAREFGEAASIGSKIGIDGKELPFRPACCIWYRGLSAHKHSMLSGMAAETLNILIGAIEVPGGLIAEGNLPSILTEDGFVTAQPGSYHVAAAYPPRKVVPPKTPDLFELLPVACYSRPFFILGVLRPDTFKTPSRIDMLIQVRSNFMKTSLPRNVMLDVIKAIPFVVSFCVELDETSEFADVVFPDLQYLERTAFGHDFTIFVDRGGYGPGFWYGQRQVVPAMFVSPWGKGLQNISQVLFEMADRAGFLPDCYKALNRVWKLKDQYKLDPTKKYSFEQLCDHYFRSEHGEDRGWDWYLKDGLVVRNRTPEEMYPGPFRKGRIHLYYEFMLDAGREVGKVTSELKIPWETEDYVPLPDWKPCASYEKEKTKDFDMFMVNYKVPQQSWSSVTQSNPILNQLSDRHRDFDVRINPETAKQKGIKHGDMVVVENTKGIRVEGRVRISELIHPEVVASLGNSGRYARQFQGKRRGIHFNDMVIFDEDHIDYVSAAVDSCVRVKLTKVD